MKRSENRSRCCPFIAAIAGFVCAAILAETAPAFGTWTIEIVDSAGDVGRHTSLALDSSDDPRLSYFDQTNSDLRYAFRVGSAWTIEVVDPNLVAGRTSLALNASDEPRISYLAGTFLRCGIKSGSSWAIEQVDSTMTGSLVATSIDVNAVGPQISYRAVGNLGLKIAARVGSAWSTETADATVGAGIQHAIAIDSQSYPRVAHRRIISAAQVLAYSAKSVSGWTTETVDAVMNISPSIALDAQDNPRVAYHQVGLGGGLKYAYKNGSVWTVEFVENNSGAGAGGVSLALDDSGNPRIAYAGTQLKYAVKTGSAWIIEFIDITQTSDPSLQLTASQAPCIGYFETTNSNLKFASGAGATSVAPISLAREFTIFPNPAQAGRVRVALRLDADPHEIFSLSVFDATGRRVRELARGEQGGGLRTIEWDGRDDSGRSVASGTYLMRLDSRAGASASTFTIVR